MGQGLWPLVETEREMGMSLYRMMRRGIKIDTTLTEKLLTQGQERMSEITNDLGFKPSETTKLTPFLLEELKLPVLKRSAKTGKPSFAKEVMEEYELILGMVNDERATQILEFRGWQKACSSFYNPYLQLLSPDGRLRAGFKLHGTITSRLSCEKPNLQQIPRRTDKYGAPKAWIEYLYDCFIPEDGYELWVFDYKNLEFRLAAVYSGDKELIDRINNGEDVHQASRDMIANLTGLEFDRYPIKTTNFLKLYGGQRNRLALQLKVKEHRRDDKKCNCNSCIVDAAWNKTFSSMVNVMQDCERRAKERGYIQYWSGRRKHYGTYWNKGEEHKAFNALCQGGGAEVTKNALVNLKSLESPEVRPILTVHDSIVWEIRKTHVSDFVPQIQKVMEDFNFSVDLKVDTHIWGQD